MPKVALELDLVPASAPQLLYQKAVVCTILCGVVRIKYPLLLIGKSFLCSGASGFPL